MQKEMESYYEEIRSRIPDFSGDCRQFLEDFCNKQRGPLNRGRQAIIRRLERHSDTVEPVDELFPADLYPALDLILGEDGRMIFLEGIECLRAGSFSSGEMTSLRSRHIEYHLNEMISLFSAMAGIHMKNADLEEVMGWQGPMAWQYVPPVYFTSLINLEHKELLKIIDQRFGAAADESLPGWMMEAVLASRDHRLLEKLGEILVKAGLQEGLRDFIAARIDQGPWENFVKLFHLIAKKQLLRFPAIRKHLIFWTGLAHEGYLTQVKFKDLPQDFAIWAQAILERPEMEADYLQSGDPFKIHLALWHRTAQDVDAGAALCHELIERSREDAFLVAHLAMTASVIPYGESPARHTLAKHALAKYPGDLQIGASFLPFFMTGLGDFQLGKMMNASSDFTAGRQSLLAHYFASPEEAITCFRLLMDLSRLSKTKPVKGTALVFPWNKVALDRGELTERALFIAALLPGELTEEAMTLCKDYRGLLPNHAFHLIFSEPETPGQVEFLLREIGREGTSSEAAASIIAARGYHLEFPGLLEAQLRLKSEEVRSRLLRLLAHQPMPDLQASILRLLAHANEQIRLGGLDLALMVKTNGNLLSAEVLQKIRSITEFSGPEGIQIQQLLAAADPVDPLKHLYRPSDRSWLTLTYTESQGSEGSGSIVVSTRDFHESHLLEWKLKLMPLIDWTAPVARWMPILKKLDDLIELHSREEYCSYFDRPFLLGDNLWPTAMVTDPARSLDQYPLAELWRDFYDLEIRDYKDLLQIHLITQVLRARANNSRSRYWGFLKDVMKFDAHGAEEFRKYHGIQYLDQMSAILSAMETEWRHKDPDNRRILLQLSNSVLFRLLKNPALKFTGKEYDTAFQLGSVFGGYFSSSLLEIPLIGDLYEGRPEDQTEEEFFTTFILKYHLVKRVSESMKRKKRPDDTPVCQELDFAEWNMAGRLGLVPADVVYQQVLEGRTADAMSKFSGELKQIREWQTSRERSRDNEPLPGFIFQEAAIRQMEEMYATLAAGMAEAELTRGNEPTPYSASIGRIDEFSGIEVLKKLLNALENEKFQRSSYRFFASDRKGNLSHMLAHSRPGRYETNEDFRSIMTEAGIGAERLVEVALFAPIWIPMIQDYLAWPGFQDACYYFLAHSIDVDEKSGSIIAAYTPLSLADLRDGAFDINWFRTAYGKIGMERFEIIYKAAKYTSGGSSHTRARKFADAVNGKMDLQTTEVQIAAKRNKDLVASYGLIPLTDQDPQADLLRRYEFLQRFLRESKAFGALRQNSEKRAVEIALENLSTNAGFRDVTRLTLRMEKLIFENQKYFFVPREIGEYTAQLSFNEMNQVELTVQKGGKALKALPSALKGDPYVRELKNFQKELKEQYRRAKVMFENAMEEETPFQVAELQDLSLNPVARRLIESLVWKHGEILGRLTDRGLDTLKGRTQLKETDQLILAHPVDLLASGQWSDFQRQLVEQRIREPFKQVFRELYLPMDDETDREDTERYSGYAVLLGKGAAALRSRRWIMDYQMGLRKVYYGLNIVVDILESAQWNEPAGEGTTIDRVLFTHRNTGQPIPIKDLPPKVFSEVMRDVDLLISLAGVGSGDPETSPAAMAMRGALIESTLPLFNLVNVTIKDHHALIQGSLGEYSIHLGTGVIHQKAGTQLLVKAVSDQERGRVFLPFMDEDPKTAEVLTKVLTFARDTKIRDPFIISQIKRSER